MTEEEKMAAVTGDLDKTQVVSLKDLEELERLQLASATKKTPVNRPRTAVPLSAVLGLLAAVVLAAALVAVYLHYEARSSAPQTAAQRSR